MQNFSCVDMYILVDVVVNLQIVLVRSWYVYIVNA